MTEKLTIPRIDFDNDPAPLDRLRRQGIEWLQQLSGKHWTDFNEHDPGVTTLEQLCYCLSELLYDISHPVADYLVDDNGNLDLVGQALYPPEQILPFRPTTEDDLRRSLSEVAQTLSQVRDLKVSPMGGKPGLYRVSLQLGELGVNEHTAGGEGAVRKALVDHFAAKRNLGEDIGEIVISDARLCSLQLHWETRDIGAADEQCARLLWEAEQWLEQQKVQTAQGLPVESLKKTLLHVDGIRWVDHIQLTARESFGCDDATSQVRLMVRFPSSQTTLEKTFKARFEGNPVALSYSRVYRYYLQLSRQEQINDVDAMVSTDAINAQDRQLHQYWSVMNHFPKVYGVKPDAHGQQRYAQTQPLRWAKVKQLKGYLLLFDQWMSDCKSLLAQMRYIYSATIRLPDDPLSDAVMKQMASLDEHTIPGIGEIYPEKSSRAQSRRSYAFIHDMTRKEQVLDQMLAMYGESLDQQLLKKFPPDLPADALKLQLLVNKAGYLRAMVQMTRDRGGGVNYTRDVSEQAPNFGFLQKLCAHLGMVPGESLNSSSMQPNPGWVSDNEFLALYPPSDGPMTLWHPVNIGSPSKLRPMSGEGEAPVGYSEFSKQLLESTLLQGEHGRGPTLPQSLLQQGQHLHNYHLLEKDNGELHLVVTVKLGQGKDGFSWLFLGEYADEQSARQQSRLLSHYLKLLNYKEDHLYVVDHILLRDNSDPVDTWFHWRVSLVMPGWTTRGRDQGFRVQAERVVRQLCPAHIHPQLLWLSQDQLRQFEQCYRNWQSAKQAWPYQTSVDHSHSSARPQQIGSTAAQLRKLLQQAEQAAGGQSEQG